MRKSVELRIGFKLVNLSKQVLQIKVAGKKEDPKKNYDYFTMKWMLNLSNSNLQKEYHLS